MAFLNTAPSMDFSVLILNLKSIISNFMLVVWSVHNLLEVKYVEFENKSKCNWDQY